MIQHHSAAGTDIAPAQDEQSNNLDNSGRADTSRQPSGTLPEDNATTASRQQAGFHSSGKSRPAHEESSAAIAQPTPVSRNKTQSSFAGALQRRGQGARRHSLKPLQRFSLRFHSFPDYGQLNPNRNMVPGSFEGVQRPSRAETGEHYVFFKTQTMAASARASTDKNRASNHQYVYRSHASPHSPLHHKSHVRSTPTAKQPATTGHLGSSCPTSHRLYLKYRPAPRFPVRQLPRLTTAISASPHPAHIGDTIPSNRYPIPSLAIPSSYNKRSTYHSAKLVLKQNHTPLLHLHPTQTPATSPGVRAYNSSSVTPFTDKCLSRIQPQQALNKTHSPIRP
ncbi:hypothetical protein CONLIGDRAFT_107823 [Coniochaeta ligniaria NRRL 30616]|uniref:Uncharacterized protein n=1 Tax=Coniochaeta ligniaria NRRL 30616 TaxID=1408157 RepID=A0A1J7IA89_9PEZI|nr:hypothetical protein CONLIGDRAFT_107823 [Coniochaeta ligniaria NRRL 30616]